LLIGNHHSTIHLTFPVAEALLRLRIARWGGEKTADFHRDFLKSFFDFALPSGI
jgi:hypothetical protein